MLFSFLELNFVSWTETPKYVLWPLRFLISKYKIPSSVQSQKLRLQHKNYIYIYIYTLSPLMHYLYSSTHSPSPVPTFSLSITWLTYSLSLLWATLLLLLICPKVAFFQELFHSRLWDLENHFCSLTPLMCLPHPPTSSLLTSIPERPVWDTEP